MICTYRRREERRKEVGCQWESPEEHTKEVGCQSDAAERRDAAVQVDLQTQQLSWRHSGVPWQCGAVRAGEPGGGALLQLCGTHTSCGKQHVSHPLLHATNSPALYLLCPALLPTVVSEHVETSLHPWSSPSPSAPVLTPAGGSAAPPGLIAPLSPRLAEEEEEDLPKDDNEECFCSNQAALKERKMEKEEEQRRRRPNGSKRETLSAELTNHIAGKVEPSRRRKQKMKLLKEDEEFQASKQGEKQQQPAAQTQEEQQERERMLMEKKSEEETGGKVELMKDEVLMKEGGGIKSVTMKNEEVEAQRPRRRMVGPTVRYLLESEQVESHGPTAANHSRAREDKVKRKVGRPRKEQKEVEEAVEEQTESSGVESPGDTGAKGWWQLCQVCGVNLTSQASLDLHMSTHGPKQMFGCHLCSRKFSCASKLRLHHRCHLHGSGDDGLHCSGDGVGPSSTQASGDKQEGQDNDTQSDEDEEEGPGCSVESWTLKIRREEVQGKDGGRQMKKCREEVKQVSAEEEELAQRPRRMTIGPPIRYLVESEETSRGPGTDNQTNQEDANKPTPRRRRPKMVASLSEAGGGSSERTDRPEAEENSHMVTMGGREEEEEPQRRPICPPIRYLLESEEMSHGSQTANQGKENKPTGRRRRPKKVSDLSEVGGRDSEVIDGCQAEAKEKRHMVQKARREEEKDEEPQRERRTVCPPIRYLLDSKETSHSSQANQDAESKPTGKSSRPKKVFGLTDTGGRASEMTDRPEADAKKSHMVQKARREDEKEEEHQRPRMTVGPPIRYVLDSEETSHGLQTANQDAENPTRRTGSPQKVSVHTSKRMFGCHLCNRKFTRAGKLLLHHRHHHHSNRDGAGPSSTRTTDDKREEQDTGTPCDEEQEKTKPLLTGPTKAPYCSGDIKRVSKNPRWLFDYWTLKVRRKGAREKDEGRGTKRCREEDEEERRAMKQVCVEKEPQRPRRTMVGPPIRYLLESEETSDSKQAANKQAERRQTSEKDDDLSEAGGGASEAEDKETGHMVAIAEKEKEEEEPRQRPRRTVGPPIRYLLEAEETSRGLGTVNETNQEAANKYTGRGGRTETAISLSEAGGGASKMIDRSEAGDKEMGPMVQKARREDEQEEEPQRPRRTVGPPMRYLLDSEEMSPNQDAENKPTWRTGRPQTVSVHRPKRMFGCRLCNRKFTRAGKLLLHHRRHHSNRDGLQGNGDWAGPSSTRATDDKQEEQDRDAQSDEEQEEQPQRPRRTTVGPPIRYLLESEEMSGTANQSTAVKLIQRRGRPKKVVGGSEAGGGASGMIDRPEAAVATERQTGVHTETHLVYRDLQDNQVTITPCCIRMQRLL
ncbi:trichohyalin-like [Archocentrus centrarchus]|uniref:trichohyalin-like n=1 Tax=Archocentrus centrarchus TaxID=63155 RepID=UPI0011EA0553|nr:trichohyalin-like [Archocentrus centrarchus]